jgi:hypothetical protein
MEVDVLSGFRGPDLRCDGADSVDRRRGRTSSHAIGVVSKRKDLRMKREEGNSQRAVQANQK